MNLFFFFSITCKVHDPAFGQILILGHWLTKLCVVFPISDIILTLFVWVLRQISISKENFRYYIIENRRKNELKLLLLSTERFNESIFDALPTYLLNICEVCGSSQCPYCAIYNGAARLTALLLVPTLLAIVYNILYNT